MMGSFAGGAVVVVVAVVLLVNMLHGQIPLPPDQATGVTPNGLWPAAANVPGNYAEVYQALSVTIPQPAPSDTPAVTPTGETIPFSGPYTDLTGINDADMTVTDGQSIFTANGYHVSVVSAAGAGSGVRSTIDASELAAAGELPNGPVVGLVRQGTTLAVIVQGFAANPDQWSVNADTYGVEVTSVKIGFYDVSDPANPKRMSVVSQSGAYLGTRVVGGVLYLVTTLTIDPANVDPGNPATFVPSVDDGNGPRPVAPERLRVLQSVTRPVFAVVTGSDMAKHSLTDQQVVFGYPDTVHITESNLYLQESLPGPPAKRGDVSVPGFENYADVREAVVRMGFGNGTLSVAPELIVPAATVFGVDELDGYLRVAATWPDHRAGAGNWTLVPQVWVFDQSLKLVGSLPQELTAPADENRVRYVRIDGPVCYVETYRENDPMFAIDLSDPANPRVLGDTFMPGMPGASYLHPYGSGLTLGVTRTGFSNGIGSDDGLQLSMFDTSDPYGVRQLDLQQLPIDDTEIYHDPRSVYVDPERGLIGFPSHITTADPAADARSDYVWEYHMYAWTGSGFEPAGTMTLFSGPASTTLERARLNDRFTRALGINNSLYVVTSMSVQVYDAGTLELQRGIPLI